MVVILDTVTIRHFIVLGEVATLRHWVGGDLAIPRRVHQELLAGVEKHDAATLSTDPATAQVRSARFRAYPQQYTALGITVLDSPDVSTLSPGAVKLLATLDAQTLPAIHTGEKEVILQAYETGSRICTDDRGAYLTIQNLNHHSRPGVPHRLLQVVGTPGLLAEQMAAGTLTLAEAETHWAAVQEVWRWAPRKTLAELLDGEYW